MFCKTVPGQFQILKSSIYLANICSGALPHPELCARPGGCGPTLLEFLLKHSVEGKPSSVVHSSSSGGSVAQMRQDGTDIW